jgi:hypothetical protein
MTRVLLQTFAALFLQWWEGGSPAGLVLIGCGGDAG